MTAHAGRLFTSLDAIELQVVARTVVATRRMRLCGVASAATRLGNGWIYPLVSLLVPLRILASCAVTLAVAFAIYPTCKRVLARTRPCDYAPWLARHPEPLDRYSCPSGHAMTATAYAIPLVCAWPEAAPLAIGVWAVIGWSRIAVGHHYVSDVLFGTLLGALIATPVVLFAL